MIGLNNQRVEFQTKKENKDIKKEPVIRDVKELIGHSDDKTESNNAANKSIASQNSVVQPTHQDNDNVNDDQKDIKGENTNTEADQGSQEANKMSADSIEPEKNDSLQDSTDESVTAEHIEEDAISVEPTPLDEDEISELGNDDNLIYKTKQVASFLGISEQLVRNYCSDFDEFLDIEKTVTGQRRFKKKDIIQLSQILQIKQAKNFDVNQTRDYLRGDSGKVALALPEDKVNVMLALVHDEVKRAITEAHNDLKLLEQKKDEEAEKHLQEELTKKDKEIDDLKEMLRRNTEQMERMSETMETSNKQILEKLEKKRFSLFRRG